jgi:uncharacterized membrane protein
MATHYSETSESALAHRPASLPSAYEGETNIAPVERVGSLALGGALALYGVRSGSWLGVPLALAGAALMYRGAAGHSALYERLDINLARPEPEASSIEVVKTITVNKSPSEVYAFWRQLDNLPKFMRHLRSVERIGDNRWHWVAAPPMTGKSVEWDSEIIEDRPDELIRWRTLPDSAIFNAGTVHFKPAPGGRGTEVRVEMRYRPPSSAAVVLSRLMQPINAQIVKQEIARFKSVIEAGEVPTVEGQPAARTASSLAEYARRSA